MNTSSESDNTANTHSYRKLMRYFTGFVKLFLVTKSLYNS